MGLGLELVSSSIVQERPLVNIAKLTNIDEDKRVLILQVKQQRLFHSMIGQSNKSTAAANCWEECGWGGRWKGAVDGEGELAEASCRKPDHQFPIINTCPWHLSWSIQTVHDMKIVLKSWMKNICCKLLDPIGSLDTLGILCLCVCMYVCMFDSNLRFNTQYPHILQFRLT